MIVFEIQFLNFDGTTMSIVQLECTIALDVIRLTVGEERAETIKKTIQLYYLLIQESHVTQTQFDTGKKTLLSKLADLKDEILDMGFTSDLVSSFIAFLR